MRRQKLLVALVALTVVVAVGTLMLWPVPGRVTNESFDRIRNGMKRSDVEAIIGPPGDYRTWSESNIYRPLINLMGGWQDWQTDSGLFCVAYDPSGYVCDTYRQQDNSPEPGSLEKLVRRAKRQWHRWFP
jgi:hypothetical protein